MYRKYLILFVILSFFLCSCSEKKNREPLIYKELDQKMDKIAESYVKLVLNVGLHDPDFVDAYYGPKEWIPKKDTVDLKIKAFCLYNSKSLVLNCLA